MTATLRIAIVLMVGLLAGCGKKVDEVRVQPGVQPGEAGDSGYLALQIVKSYSNQTPVNRAPWHADGGDWTFLDCQLGGNEAAAVVIGVRTRTSATKESPFGWGEVVLAVIDTDAGARFVEAFSKAFQQAVPASHGNKPLLRLNASSAVLGSGLKRDPQGGFKGEGGAWTATKWFVGSDSEEAEVYFNYSVADKKAEFSEKDPDYAEALVEQFVICLRDGPLPERTPENDPNLTLTGPKVIGWTKIADEKYSGRFTPDSQSVILTEKLTNGASGFSMWTEASGVKPLGSFDGPAYVKEFLTNSQELRMLVCEFSRPNPKVFSTADPMLLWILSPSGRQAINVPREITNWFSAERGISDDERYVAVGQWKGPAGKNRTRVIHLGEIATQKWQVIEMPDTALELVGWRNGRGIVLTGIGIEKGEIRRAFELDPATGKLAPLDQIPAEFRKGTRVSPDGRYTLLMEEKQRLVVKEASGKAREFKFHPNDRRSAYDDTVRWASPAYLVCQWPRTALINIDSLKMNYPTAKDSGFLEMEFSADFKHALASQKDGVYVSRVELPAPVQ